MLNFILLDIYFNLMKQTITLQISVTTISRCGIKATTQNSNFGENPHTMPYEMSHVLDKDGIKLNHTLLSMIGQSTVL